MTSLTWLFFIALVFLVTLSASKCCYAFPPEEQMRASYLVAAARQTEFPGLGEKTVNEVVSMLAGKEGADTTVAIIFASCAYVETCRNGAEFSEEFMTDRAGGVHNSLRRAISDSLELCSIPFGSV